MKQQWSFLHSPFSFFWASLLLCCQTTVALTLTWQASQCRIRKWSEATEWLHPFIALQISVQEGEAFARTYQLSACPTSSALSADGMYIKGPFELIQLNVYSVLFFRPKENRREFFCRVMILVVVNERKEMKDPPVYGPCSSVMMSDCC